MKFLFWTLGIVAILGAVFFGIEMLASERVEVVDLHAMDATNEVVTTRLWIVDDEGFQYLRASGDESGWYNRVINNESVAVTRNGLTENYVATIRLDKTARINQLMADKYTWGNTFIGYLVGSREESIPVELHTIVQF